MRSTADRVPRQDRHFLSINQRAAAAALALATTVAWSAPAAAASIDLSGTGTFKAPSAAQLASLPADMPFSVSDLQSGRWSFVIRYDDRAADVDPDPYVGRYVGAIRSFRVTIGNTTIEMPVDRADLIVSDGGLGFRHRESIRLDAASFMPVGELRVGWVQVNQRSTSDDLRGAVGVLPSDALPAPSVIANLASAGPFDRFFYLRIDRPGEATRPLIYLSSSQVSVAAAAADTTR